MVFVNSMSDLFHTDVPEGFIARVFAVMEQADRHTFQVLTKRPARMARLVNSAEFMQRARLMAAFTPASGDERRIEGWPPPNIWLGTSVENQRWADIRVPHLLRTPAAVRFLSCEPLLGPVDLTAWLGTHREAVGEPSGSIEWVIVGGESGRNARPMHPDWARSLRDQCVATGVPFFFKQWGGRTPKAGGRELDGRTWDEMPTRFSAAALAG
jgi:protein gp37